MISNDITNIDKIIYWRLIITNVVLNSGWGIAVCPTRSRSESRVIERIDMKDKNNIGRPIPPSNHSILRY